MLLTGDIYTIALNNPNAKFLRKRNDQIYYFNHLGVLMSEITGISREVPQLNEEWELVRQPVDFMTAVNSGKRFRPESWVWSTDDNFRNLYDNLNAFSGRQIVQVQILNGKWFIE